MVLTTPLSVLCCRCPQLRLYQVLEGAKMRRSGFTYRRIFAVFFHRYYKLAPFGTFDAALDNTQTRDYKLLCQTLVPILWRVLAIETVWEQAVQYGTTMIFIRGGVAQQLEQAKNRYEVGATTAVLALQSIWRMSRVRRKFVRLQRGVQRVQANFRTKRAVTAYRRTTAAIVVINRVVNTFMARARFLKQRAAARAIQRSARKFIAILRWKRRRRALHLLHAASRGYIARMQVGQTVRAVLVIQLFCRKCLRMFRLERRQLEAALKIQAAYRSHRARLEHPDELKAMAEKRVERAAKKSLAVLQARWKRVLVRRRFTQLRQAAVNAQAWAR